MMGVVSVQYRRMKIDARVGDKCLKKLVNEVGIKSPDDRSREGDVEVEICTPRDVDDDTGKRVVERSISVSESLDSKIVTQCISKPGAKSNPYVLDEMVLIDMQVARRLNVETEPSVGRKRLEHMIEKTDPG